MFQYNLKIASRNLFRHKIFAFINILGLSIGLGSAFIILLYVLHERSYNNFHTNRNRICRVVNKDFLGDAPYVLGTTLENAIPEIEKTARISYSYGLGNLYIKQNASYIKIQDYAFADNSLFSVFSFPVLSGNKEMMLADPNSVVVSKQMALRIFGSIDISGKMLAVELYGAPANVKITGVFEIPTNSTIREDVIFPVDFQFNHQKANGIYHFGKDPKTAWNYYLYDTYFLLKEGSNIPDVESKFARIDAGLKNGFSKEFKLQKLKDVYLHSGKSEANVLPRNEVATLQIYTSIAVLILLIAIINYIILAIAKDSRKINEIVIRIISGAPRISIIGNKVYETLLTALIALPLAFTFVEFFTPWFSSLVDRPISISYAGNTAFFLGVFVITMISGLISGGISGIFLSGYKPAELLARRPIVKFSGISIRSVLITFQFVIAIVLAICLITIYSQLNFIFKKKDPGFMTSNILVIKCTNKEIAANMGAFKERLKSNSAIQNVAATSCSLPNRYSDKEDLILNHDSLSLQKVEAIDFDDDFVDVMGIKLLEGRSFSTGFNDKESILVNEQTVKTLNLKNPIGTQTSLGNIIGVVKDFNIHSLHTAIPPMVLFNRYSSADEIVVRLRPGSEKNKVISFIKKQWQETTNHEIMDYRFVDDDIKILYLKETSLSSIISVFLFLAIFLSLLGLYGISVFTSQLRTKEVGIRKVNGANRLSIALLLTNYISKLVLAATLIACPIAWWSMQVWLQNFSYHISIKWWFFALAGLISLVIALITVGGHVFRIAGKNPIEALRYE